jgi:hypothetical protein
LCSGSWRAHSCEMHVQMDSRAASSACAVHNTQESTVPSQQAVAYHRTESACSVATKLVAESCQTHSCT